MSEKLTVIIPCKNERLNIRPCIESVRGLADEILVADSGSTDGTLDIVADIGGCRVIEREYINSGDFKNWAIPQASHDWVLLVDADERVTEPLAAEIRQLLQSGPAEDGYWIRRANHFLGHRVRYGGWANDKVLRFFRRDQSRYEGPSDHGEVVVKSGKVGWIDAKFDHFTYWSYEQMIGKLQRYQTVQAQQWFEHGHRTSFWQLAFRPPLRFLRDYVFKLGFLDGTVGLQVALTAAMYSYMKQAGLWELTDGMRQPDPEADRPASKRAA